MRANQSQRSFSICVTSRGLKGAKLSIWRNLRHFLDILTVAVSLPRATLCLARRPRALHCTAWEESSHWRFAGLPLCLVCGTHSLWHWLSERLPAVAFIFHEALILVMGYYASHHAPNILNGGLRPRLCGGQSVCLVHVFSPSEPWHCRLGICLRHQRKKKEKKEKNLFRGEPGRSAYSRRQLTSFFGHLVAEPRPDNLQPPEVIAPPCRGGSAVGKSHDGCMAA